MSAGLLIAGMSGRGAVSRHCYGDVCGAGDHLVFPQQILPASGLWSHQMCSLTEGWCCRTALFTRGLPLRIVMIGTLTGLQWGIYDAFKVYVGL